MHIFAVSKYRKYRAGKNHLVTFKKCFCHQQSTCVSHTPNSYAEILMPSWMVFGCGTCLKCLSYEVEPSRMGFILLWKSRTDSSLSFHRLRTKMVSDTIFFLTTGVSNVELGEWNSAWLLMLLRAGSRRERLTKELGTSLMIQWLRCHVSNARGADSIPGWGVKILHASGLRSGNIEGKHSCNKLIKTPKMVYIKKKNILFL